MNVLETSGALLMAESGRSLEYAKAEVLFVGLAGAVAFLVILLVVTLSLCLAQRGNYERRIKAATASFGVIPFMDYFV